MNNEDFIKQCEAKRDKLINNNPALMAFQYEIDHALLHCDTTEDRLKELGEMLRERVEALTEAQNRLADLLRGLKKC